MLTRIVSGVVGIGLFLAACFAGLLPFAAVAVLVAAIGATEFVRGQMNGPPVDRQPDLLKRMAGFLRAGNAAATSLSLAVIPVALAAARTGATPPLLVIGALITLGVAIAVCLVIHGWNGGGMLGWLRAVYGKVGFWYIACFSSLVMLRALPGRAHPAGVPEADRGAWLVLCVAVCVWASDTFAFFAGRALGKHKLAPKLSPAKTVEGFVGGLVGAAATGSLFGSWMGLSMVTGLVIGLIAGVLGPIGDLFESGMKRELGIKDFGAIMPGHGGVLDRFDSILFAAPVAYLYLLLVTR